VRPSLASVSTVMHSFVFGLSFESPLAPASRKCFVVWDSRIAWHSHVTKYQCDTPRCKWKCVTVTHLWNLGFQPSSVTPLFAKKINSLAEFRICFLTFCMPSCQLFCPCLILEFSYIYGIFAETRGPVDLIMLTRTGSATCMHNGIMPLTCRYVMS
jgi:hypothetical protein